MFALVEFTGISEMAVEKRIAEDSPNALNAKRLSAGVIAVPLFGEDTVLGEKFLHVFERFVSRCKRLERFFDKRGNVRINDNGFCSLVVQVSAWGEAGEISHPGLVREPSLRIAAELVAVLFRLHEFMAEIGFSLWRVFKPKRRKFQISQKSFVEEIYDLASVFAVPRQPVGMPCENPVRFTRLNPFHHGVE